MTPADSSRISVVNALLKTHVIKSFVVRHTVPPEPISALLLWEETLIYVM